MKKVKFKVACNAIYDSELVVEDGTTEEILSQIWDRIGETPVYNIEWLSDYEDPSESVMIEDIRSIEDVEVGTNE